MEMFFAFVGGMIYIVVMGIFFWLAIRFVGAVEKMTVAVEKIAEKLGGE